jgi:hypothetical protein
VLTWFAVARVSVALLLVVAGPRPSRGSSGPTRSAASAGPSSTPGPSSAPCAGGPTGPPEPWTLIKRDQCRHLAAYARSDKRSPSRDQVVAVHVLTHEAMHLSGRLVRRPPSARPSSATSTR